MSVIIDQPGGSEGDGLGATGVTPAKDRQRPYAWTCANCSTQNVGYIEDGCSGCAVGHGMQQLGPLPPVDFNCRACVGKGKVERRCQTCGGSGSIDLGIAGATPAACTTCGGAGALGMDCARCGGSGLDPEPQAKMAAKEPPMGNEQLQEQIDNAESKRQALREREEAKRMNPLPTLEGVVTHSRRYAVVEISGTDPTYVGAFLELDVTEREFVMPTCVVTRRAVEIAASPTTDRLFRQR